MFQTIIIPPYHIIQCLKYFQLSGISLNYLQWHFSDRLDTLHSPVWGFWWYYMSTTTALHITITIQHISMFFPPHPRLSLRLHCLHPSPRATFQWSARAPLINTSTHVLQIQLCHLQSSLLLTFTPRPQLTGTRSSSPLSSPQQVIYVQFICTQWISYWLARLKKAKTIME